MPICYATDYNQIVQLSTNEKWSSMELTFKIASNDKAIQKILDYTIDAFSDSPDFKWTFDEIKHEVSDGWELYGVHLGDEIIAAVFLKEDDNCLFTKNTAIKMGHQGSGFSHQIKDFFADQAHGRQVQKIVHYCRIDNFRMYSLNESHGYKKTERKLGQHGHIVEWIKDLKDGFERKKK